MALVGDGCQAGDPQSVFLVNSLQRMAAGMFLTRRATTFRYICGLLYCARLWGSMQVIRETRDYTVIVAISPRYLCANQCNAEARMLQMKPCSHAAMEQWHQYEQTAGSGAGQPSLKQPGTCIYISRSSMAVLQLDVSSRSACHGFRQFDAAGFSGCNAGQPQTGSS